MELERISPKQRKMMIDAYEAMLLTEIDSSSVLSAAKGGRKDLYIIDVRDASSFAEGHVPGAVNIPTDEVEMKFRLIPNNKTLVLYGWSRDCLLAPRAAIKLSQLDLFSKIMKTGFNGWVAAKRPVDR